ncbi:DUF5683 domain-containing protein [Rubrivirga marina]|uniref:DUF5683 domain-containing protein n=1 Tax=Rubrivirga marina TaxID=1196024 RepID=A0A271J2V5_9BACT|nr:DUF5683 domain-containing protein [Rubrivirga marina]PAP77851.1 hypothetical protein BSZ37_16085 [Rubrivirga marina]
MRSLFAAALALGLAAAPTAQVVDSLAAPTEAAVLDSLSGRTPRGAVTRALVIPGLGQLYNRQPVKAPVATALVVGAVVYFVDRQRQYILYRRATAYAGCLEVPGDPETTPDRIEICAEPLDEYGDEYEVARERVATPTFSTLSSVRSRARGQRDIGGVVVLAAYALQALDAYVSAELADFDVSEDLSLRVDPTPDGPALGLRIRL